VDSLTFREEHTSKVIAFKENLDGEIIQLLRVPPFVFDKVNFVQSATHTDGFSWLSITVHLAHVILLAAHQPRRRGYELMDSPIPLPLAPSL